MLTYICRRVAIGILTVYIIVTLVFALLRVIPGDPVDVWLGDYATPELIELTRAKWGLDQPIWGQYMVYIKNLMCGDLGNSLRMRIPIAELIIRHYPYTLRLVFLGTLLSIIISVPAGILAAVRQNSFTDMFVMIFSFLFISMPHFWLGLLLLYFFSFRLGWFPAIGGEGGGNYLVYFSYLVLPSLSMGFRHAGQISRMVRSTMIDTLSKDYITVARSKGISEHVIRYKLALRNALAPIISLTGVMLALSIAGAVILEVVFSRPGLGRLYVGAVAARDYPVVQGCVLIIATGVVLINLLVDISYGIIDPRIRYE
jgi:ABC-type dipeptide/oligopeptide/nickel transport system permease component